MSLKNIFVTKNGKFKEKKNISLLRKHTKLQTYLVKLSIILFSSFFCRVCQTHVAVMRDKKILCPFKG